MQNMDGGEALAGLWFRMCLPPFSRAPSLLQSLSNADRWLFYSIHEMQELSSRWWKTGECVVEALAS